MHLEETSMTLVLVGSSISIMEDKSSAAVVRCTAAGPQ